MKAIFLHCYYSDIVDEMLTAISRVNFPFNLYVNIVEQEGQEIVYHKVVKLFPNAQVFISENIGHDIGGQLVLMNYWLTTPMIEDEIIFLQTKKSPQHIEGGNEWRRELMRIILPENQELIKEKLSSQQVGMIGSSRWLITDEKQCYHFLQPELNYLCGLLGMKNIEAKNYGFIGGTMFIVKAKIYKDFFTKNNPIKIRELMNSVAYSHAMERLLGFIVLDAGYKIKGI